MKIFPSSTISNCMYFASYSLKFARPFDKSLVALTHDGIHLAFAANIQAGSKHTVDMRMIVKMHKRIIHFHAAGNCLNMILTMN